ncbi:hypothetical protein CTA1_12162 [Colletotrichum tanaceti]|uniref:Uncharacterized protein n=1 Tax=Colletotrichum tanaceti TaxID=1306861 RepID=A0A4U6X0C7_9PEZI|nr:hypothetical protein CTA1_12162 [Colletotrichum tanaceti]
MLRRLEVIARKAQEAQTAISAMENKDGPKANERKVNGGSVKESVEAKHDDLADHDLDDLLDFIEVKLESLYLQDKEGQQPETKLQSLNLQNKEKQQNASQLEAALENLNLQDKQAQTAPPLELANIGLKTEDSVVLKKSKNKNRKKNKKQKKIDACKAEEEGAQETKNEGDTLQGKLESTIGETKARVPEVKEDAQKTKAKTNTAPKSQDDDGGGVLLVAATEERSAPRSKAEKEAEDEAIFFEQWNEYFGKRELADWQRLCRDLGLPDDLPSKTQCSKAINKVHVNIKQFLSVTDRPAEVKVFKSVRQLAHYTRKNRMWMPKKRFPKGDPLTKLRREINRSLYTVFL